MMMNNTIPFRWNIKSKSELGRLLDPDYSLDEWDLERIRDCTAKILNFTNDDDLVFVGRSLDSIYDYLSGLFFNTSDANRLRHLNISLYGQSLKDIARQDPKSILQLKHHFTELGLDPVSIKHSDKSFYFVDVVYHGGTYTELFHFLKDWSKDIHEDVPAVIRKIGFIGITRRTKNSPNTWRWHQHKDWVGQLSSGRLKNISVDYFFWSFMGDAQYKLTRSNRPDFWFHKPLEKQEYSDEVIKSINMAHQLYELAQSRDERQKIVREMNS